MGWATVNHQVCLAHLIRDVQMSKDKAIHDMLLGIKWVLHWETKRKLLEPSNVRYMRPRDWMKPFMMEPKRITFQQGVVV